MDASLKAELICLTAGPGMGRKAAHLFSQSIYHEAKRLRNYIFSSYVLIGTKSFVDSDTAMERGHGGKRMGAKQVPSLWSCSIPGQGGEVTVGKGGRRKQC